MDTSFSEIFISEKDDAENIDLLVINWSGLVKPALAVLRMTACFFGCWRVPIDKLIKMKILTISLIFSNYFIGWRFHFLKLSFLAFLLAIFKKWAQLRVCWLFAHFYSILCSMKRPQYRSDFWISKKMKWGNETPNSGKTIKPLSYLHLSSLMSVDLSILARGIPIDPLPELYG